MSHHKIERNDLKTYLINRYPKRIADYILSQIFFTGNSMKFGEYCNEVSKLSKLPTKQKMKMAFHIFDRDSDGKITCEDVLKVMEDLKKSDWLIMED